MSFKLGMIVSNDCCEETLNIVKERFEQNRKTFEVSYPEGYCLYLRKVNNIFIDNQIMPDEIHLEVSEYHDSCSPIGKWEGYDTDTLIKRIKTPTTREDLEPFLKKVREGKIKTLINVDKTYVDEIIRQSQEEVRKFEVTPSFLAEHKLNRTRLEKGSELWIDIIKFMRIEQKIRKVGLFSYMVYAPIPEMKFEKMERIECRLEDFNIEYLLKIKMNTLVFFV